MELADAETMARSLMGEHGLADWQLGWDRAVRRAGQTRFRDRTITLSRHLTALHSQAEVRDTVLHEIAHALVGPRHGHDAVWRRAAVRIGASGRRCLDDGSARVEGRWRGECPAGHVVTRHRTPTRVTSCRECARGFDLRHLLRWTFDGAAVAMHPAYADELARLTSAAASQPAAVSVGQRARITARGRFAGREGVVSAVRRTRCTVELPEGAVSVPLRLVVPVDPAFPAARGRSCGPTRTG